MQIVLQNVSNCIYAHIINFSKWNKLIGGNLINHVEGLVGCVIHLFRKQRALGEASIAGSSRVKYDYTIYFVYIYEQTRDIYHTHLKIDVLPCQNQVYATYQMMQLNTAGLNNSLNNRMSTVGFVQSNIQYHKYTNLFTNHLSNYLYMSFCVVESCSCHIPFSKKTKIIMVQQSYDIANLAKGVLDSCFYSLLLVPHCQQLGKFTFAYSNHCLYNFTSCLFHFEPTFVVLF